MTLCHEIVFCFIFSISRTICSREQSEVISSGCRGKISRSSRDNNYAEIRAKPQNSRGSPLLRASLTSPSLKALLAVRMTPAVSLLFLFSPFFFFRTMSRHYRSCIRTAGRSKADHARE